MMRPLIALGLLGASLAAYAASDLAVLPQGRYSCWTAGAANGPAVTADAENSFTIERGSSYRNAVGSGTYLLAGDLLTFTRGPLKDMRLRRSKDGYWQRIARDGELERLKCSRTSAAPVA